MQRKYPKFQEGDLVRPTEKCILDYKWNHRLD